MKIETINELNQSLKAAGLHPCQTQPTVLPAHVDAPADKMALKPGPHFVKEMSAEEQKAFARRLAD